MLPPLPDDDDIEIIDQNNNEDESSKDPDGNNRQNKSDEALPTYSSMENQNVRDIKVLLCKDKVALKIYTMAVPLLLDEMDIITTIFSNNQVLKDHLGYKLIEDNTERRIVISTVNDPKRTYNYTIEVQSPTVIQYEVVSDDDCHVVENSEEDLMAENPPKCSTPDSQETFFDPAEKLELIDQQDYENFYPCLYPENDIKVKEYRKKNDKNCDDLFAILSQSEHVEDKHVREDDEKVVAVTQSEHDEDKYVRQDDENVAETQNSISLKEIETSRFYSPIIREKKSSWSQKTVQLSDSPVLSREKTSASPRDTILAVYPPPPARGGITIYKDNYKCLGDGEFLNDVIIDFYLKYLMNEVLSEDDRNRTHVFSSQFFTRLSKRPVTDSDEEVFMSESERRHLGVQRWTKNVNIFEKDFIIIPINKHYHWNLAIICFPGLVGMINDETESLIKPCILFFDSLSNKNKDGIVAILRGYLSQEWQAKMGEVKSFSNTVLKLRYPRVPKQSNATDCGLYVLQYVEQFFKFPIVDYTVVPLDLSQWFKRDVVRHKRAEIASVVAELAKNYNPEKDVEMPTLQFPSDSVSSDEKDWDYHLAKTKNPFHKDKFPSFTITAKSPRNAESCSSAVLNRKRGQSNLDKWLDRVRDAPSSNDQHNLSKDLITFENQVYQNDDLMDVEEDSDLINDYNPSGSEDDKSLGDISDSKSHNESTFFSKPPKQYGNRNKISIIKENVSGTKSHIFQKSSIFSVGTEERSVSGVRPKREQVKSKLELMSELANKFREKKRKKELKEGRQNEEGKRINNKWIDDSDFKPNGCFDRFSVYSVSDDPGISPSTSYNNYKMQKKHNERLQQY